MTPSPTEPRTPAELFELAEASRGDARQAPLLLRLLDERHPVYEGADSLLVARMRAALIEAVAHHSLSSSALPFVLEELESASDPRLTAIAAAALRRSPESGRRFVRPLLDAVHAIHAHDVPVTLGVEKTTATLEILRTLRKLVELGHYPLADLGAHATRMLEPGARAALTADLVEGSAAARAAPDEGDALTRLTRPVPGEIADLAVEDHTGARLTFADVFRDVTTLVFFFFTRCGNPMKCPLTVARLGRLQQRIEAEGLGLRTAAFTYDPAYDTPERLLHYARGWGARPTERHRFLRVPEAFQSLRDFFELGVGYGPGGVNRHQLEVFLVDRRMTLVAAVKRRRWTEDQLLALASEVN